MATAAQPSQTATQPLSRRRWVILAIGVLAQSAASAFIYGVPFLVPTLRDTLGLSLAQVGVYVAAPTVGLLCTLIAWGAAADRWGERVVMASGMAVASIGIGALVGLTHQSQHPPTWLLLVLLAIGGAGGASVNAASGRMVMGWFPTTERGLAMGIRQTAQPLGVGIAGLTLPTLAHHLGPFPAMVLPGTLCLLSAILIAAFAPDPPRAPRKAGDARPRSPYHEPLLFRVHASSALLVVPQFAVAAFTYEYLVHERHWSIAAAGTFAAVAQLAGAGGRIGSGWWSDRVRSRLRPMRQLAVLAMLVLLMFALGDAVTAPWLAWLAPAALALGAVITVADNGLGYTATAEIAGPAWSGRALGVQNTGQNVLSALAPVTLGAVIGGSNYATGFAVAALAPLLAIAVIPVRSEPAPRW
ncbi:MFS transporter [Pseudonocardia spinosispora]|uniref:MFS transporter n=1 Tax=Pseudonocardia spinosispora TaxID=103441 RepID=UPI00040CA973|nr:MFS transporter [Pseudonocardia spinosispora]